MSTKYQTGAGFEYRVISKLEENDFYCVRSAGSHGVVDIVAFDFTHTRLIQCKHTKKKDVSLTEILKGDNILKFESLEVPPNTFKWIVIKQGRSNELLTLYYNKIVGKWLNGLMFK